MRISENSTHILSQISYICLFSFVSGESNVSDGVALYTARVTCNYLIFCNYCFDWCVLSSQRYEDFSVTKC